MQIPLAESASAVFNASGRASVSMGPTVYGSSWAIQRASISSTSTVDTDCSLYRQIESPTTLIDGTPNGNNEAYSPDSGTLDVRSGQTILFVWTGGDVGAVATVVLDGMKETGR